MKIQRLSSELSITISLKTKNYDEDTQIFNWCIDNFGIDNMGFTKRWMHLGTYETTHIFLKYEDDIILFQLTWC